MSSYAQHSFCVQKSADCRGCGITTKRYKLKRFVASETSFREMRFKNNISNKKKHLDRKLLTKYSQTFPLSINNA